MKEITDEFIKVSVEKCYKQIRETNEELDRLRDLCPHNEVKKEDYMWAPGHIVNNASICQICGKVISTEEGMYWQDYIIKEGDEYDN